MTTSNIKTFPEEPYFDDFAEDKNFNKILFRPEYRPQAREMNQFQTILQAQIDKFANHIFKDGSPVIGGNVFLDDQVYFIKVETSFTLSSVNYNISTYVNEFKDTILTGSTSGVQAKVIDVVGEENGDPITFFVKYISSGSDNVQINFTPEEDLYTDALVLRRAKVKPLSATPFGKSLFVYLGESVFYKRGVFVHQPAISLIVGKYTTNVNKKVILKTNEEIVDEGMDSSLLDNSLGSPNPNSPGAHRYRIYFTIATENLDFSSITDNHFIELLSLKNGKVTQKIDTKYSELGDILAQRTYEINGDFVTNPFKLDIKEHLDNGSNFGKYTVEQGGDSSKIYLGLEKSTAYVKGYRISLEDTKDLALDKSRDTVSVKNTVFSIQMKNYLTVHTVVGLPDLSNGTTANLRDSGNNVIGTARIRALEYLSGTKGTAGSSTGAIYKVYLFDVTLNAGKSKNDIHNILQTIAGSHNFTAVALDKSFVLTQSPLIYKLPYNVIKTLLNEPNRTTYHTIYEQRNISSDAGGVIILTASTNQIFTSVSATDWQVIKSSDGTLVPSPTISLTGSPSGTTITIAGLLNNTDYDIIGTIRKTLSQKAKTLVIDAQDNITSPSTTLGGINNLTKADILKIKNIYMSANMSTNATTSDTEVTDRYILDNGQRETHYEIGNIQLKSNSIVPTGRLLVVYDYFQHSAGDYFSVDSYADIDYSIIPSLKTTIGVLELRDCIDFRPRKSDSGADFTSTGASIGKFPLYNSLFECDLEYYLGRIDKIFVDKLGNFGIVKGNSSLSPDSPKEPKDSLGLYDIYLKPYTFSIDDVYPKIIDHKVFKNSDIAGLEKRISNIENVLITSVFENEIQSTKYFDSLSTEMIKNGFLADDFSGHSKGDVNNSDYKCSIDKNQNTLKPLVNTSLTNLIYDSSNSSNVQITGSLATLPYTEVNAISQPYATGFEKVNSYGLYNWQGNITLSPFFEKWKDTSTAPYLISDISKFYTNILSSTLKEDVFGSIFNEWKYNWFGYSSLEDYSLSQQYKESVLISGLLRKEFVTKTNKGEDTIISSYGSKDVEENYVPYMRSNLFYFKAENLKPNTRVYPFIDGISIDNYVKQETFIEFKDRSDVQQLEDFKGLTSHPNGATLTLVTDSQGKLEGSFIIPNNNSILLKSGSKKFTLTSSSTNTTNPETFAEYMLSSKGKLDNSNEFNISTRELYFDRSELSENKTSITKNVIKPILQTFKISDFEGGYFLTSVELYFKTKDASLPITLQIRPILNGEPSSYIIPFSEVTLYPSSINISSTSATSTKFTFKSPVYLKQDVDYAIAIKTKSNVYQIYRSEIGKFDLLDTSFLVNKQPYVGSFYNQNNTQNLVLDLNKDLKFKINTAQFNTSLVSNLVLANKTLPLTKLPNDALLFTNGSNQVVVSHKNHGLFPNSKVKISGVIANTSNTIRGIPITEINKIHTVTSCTFDTYTITTTTNATSSNRSIGTNILSSENKIINEYYLDIETFIINNTNISFSDKKITGKSLPSSTEVPYLQEDYVPCYINENNFTNYPYVIASDENETLLPVSGQKSYFIKANFTSTKSNLSPYIDLEKTSLINVSYRIDNNSSSQTQELSSSNTPALSKFISSVLTLPNECDTLRIEFLANRPRGSSIEVYYRTFNEGENVSQKTWVYISPESNIPVTDDKTIYNKITFKKESLNFTNAQIKIVLKSESSSKIPSIKKLVTIGLI